MDSFLQSMGFYLQAPIEDLRRIFKNYVAPTIQRGPENEDAANAALFFEAAMYEYLIKRTETDEEFKAAYGAVAEALRAIGRNFPALAEGFTVADGPPTVAFWLPGAGILAHTQQLLTLLTAINAQKTPMIKPRVYCASGDFGELRKAVEATGTPISFLGNPNRRGAMLPPITLLRERLAVACQNDGVQALVVVSTPIQLLTMCAMRVAPAIIWWSMKWHALDVPGLAGRMTPRRGTTVELGGHTWQCGHVALPVLADEKHKAARARLRTQFKIEGHHVVLGYLGREDKLSPEYGAAISAVLEANPNAMFLYTGRTRKQEFEESLKHVATRCRWVQWVNVGSIIWTIDVYADSFPMGSGHSAFAAMQAGIPVVTLMTPENCENSAASHVRQICAGDGMEPATAEAARLKLYPGSAGASQYFPGEQTLEGYHYRLCQLVQSAAMRAEVGQVQKEFVSEFLMDTERYARQTSEVILDICARTFGVPVEKFAPGAQIVEHAADTETQAGSSDPEPVSAQPEDAGAERGGGSAA